MKYGVRIPGSANHVLLVSEATFSGVCKDVTINGSDVFTVIADELLDSEPVIILNAIALKEAKV